MTQPDPNNHNNPAATENRFSGLYPNDSYPLVNGAPDFEQEKKAQARLESERTRRVSSDAPRAAHPPFTEKGPDRTLADTLAANAPITP